MIIGILGLAIGMHYNRQRTAPVGGSSKATATEQHSPIVGGIVLFSGTLLLAYPKKRMA